MGGCGTSIDHAVQATGYNAEGNYWIVRNSWGESWGESGFVWVEYGANVCGITDQATIVTVEQVMKNSDKICRCRECGAVFFDPSFRVRSTFFGHCVVLCF